MMDRYSSTLKGKDLPGTEESSTSVLRRLLLGLLSLHVYFIPLSNPPSLRRPWVLMFRALRLLIPKGIY